MLALPQGEKRIREPASAVKTPAFSRLLETNFIGYNLLKPREPFLVPYRNSRVIDRQISMTEPDNKPQIKARDVFDIENTTVPVPPEQLEHSLRLAKSIVRAAAENRGQNIVVLDLTEHTSLFDYFIIASGSSRRQLSAMGTEIDRVMKTEFGERRLSVSGYEESRWIVLDFGSVVVHLFDEETRQFYDLESLWGDGKSVDIADIVVQASAQMARFAE
jgi:ribosome-associated protein